MKNTYHPLANPRTTADFFLIGLSLFGVFFSIWFTGSLFASPSSANSSNQQLKEKPDSTTSDNQPFSGNVCSIGGCSIGHHSIPALDPSSYRELLKTFNNQPISSSSDAFEKLLYYGRQTRAYINAIGTPSLNKQRADILRNELTRTHAKVSLRIVDEQENTRVRLNNRPVPLGKSKHFNVKNTTNLQPPELSGTVYRVGVKHLWARY